MGVANQKCTILQHCRVGPGVYCLQLKAEEIAHHALPGQFVMIEVRDPNAFDPLLPRPFSISWADKSHGTIFITYKVVGRGTRLLSQYPRGAHVGVLGPLGRGFSLDLKGHRVLVGGGLGVAPIIFLQKWLASHGAEGASKTTSILGARTKVEIIGILEALGIGPKDVHITTEDGSIGEQGLVTTPLLRLIQQKPPPISIQACGPMPMLKAVQQQCCGRVDLLEVSLESFMACGIGLCLGCAHPKRDGDGYVHVCKEGPVFDAREVLL